MISFFHHKSNFPFIPNRRRAYLVSAVIFAVTIAALIMRGGLKMGVDFTGGTMMQIHFESQVSTDQLRRALTEGGLSHAEIQKVRDTDHIKNAFMIRTGLAEKGGESGSYAEQVKALLEKQFPDNRFEIDSIETVGPKIGRELQAKAVWAVLIGCLLILAYVAVRFDFRFGVAAVAALFHDVFCTIGFIAVTNMEFNLQSVAVLLTIVGYSINDSIVVADRIRENLRKSQKETYPELINRSINETLSRTVITVLTVLIVLISLQIFAGRVLADFTKPLLFGLIIGTYSSIFIVASLVVDWEQKSPVKRKK